MFWGGEELNILFLACFGIGRRIYNFWGGKCCHVLWQAIVAECYYQI